MGEKRPRSSTTGLNRNITKRRVLQTVPLVVGISIIPSVSADADDDAAEAIDWQDTGETVCFEVIDKVIENLAGYRSANAHDMGGDIEFERIPDDETPAWLEDVEPYVTIHFEADGSDAWVIEEVEGAPKDRIAGDDRNPTLTLYEDVRFTFGSLPGESHPLEFIDADGNPMLSQETTGLLLVDEPPQFLISDLQISETPIIEGDLTEISATVENVGEIEAEQVIYLRVGEQDEFQSLDVELESGGTTTVNFELDSGDLHVGEWEVAIYSQDDSQEGELVVEEEDEPDDDEDDDDVDVDDDDIADVDDTDDADDDDDGLPGFGIVSALAGIGAGVAAARKFRATDGGKESN